VAIPGTKASMVPPTGFVAATSFTGFQQSETGASILVAEIQTPATNMANGFTEQAMASRGMKLLQKQSIDLHGTQATLLKVLQEANGITYLKQMLIFGDESTTVLATGTYPASTAAEAEGPIKTSLLSAYYNKKKAVETKPVTNFTLDVAGTAFRFAQNLANSTLYTTDGKAPSAAADKALFIVSTSLGNVAKGDKKQLSIASLYKLPQGSTNKIQSVLPVTINGLSGYEIVANGKGPKSENQLVYQVMLFKTNGEYFQLVGLTDNNFTGHLTEFKTISKTFKAK
jgi:hypothetical protein